MIRFWPEYALLHNFCVDLRDFLCPSLGGIRLRPTSSFGLCRDKRNPLITLNLPRFGGAVFRIRNGISICPLFPGRYTSNFLVVCKNYALIFNFLILAKQASLRMVEMHCRIFVAKMIRYLMDLSHGLTRISYKYNTLQQYQFCN